MKKIDLKTYKILLEQSKEKEKSALTFIDGADSMMPTDKAREAQKLLSESELIISLKEMKELEETSKEEEKSAIPFLDGADSMMPTNNAREAIELLKKAKVELTLEEMKELQEASKEKEESNIAFLDIDGANKMISTERAREAEKILSKAKLVISLEEMKELQEASKEKEESKLAFLDLDGVDKMVPTDRANEAKAILAMDNIRIKSGREIEKNNAIKVEDIGKVVEDVSVADKEKAENKVNKDMHVDREEDKSI